VVRAISGKPHVPADQRLPVVDTLRSVAAVLIVLHHLAIYGPLSRALAHALPGLSSLLADYGRFAVYIFLVVAGFMAARTFGEWATRPVVPAVRLILRRYLRLVLPLAAALLLAIFCAGLARHWTNEDYVPAAANWRQFLAHLALLQSLLGFDSLTTGVWYIAAELQLFAGVILLLKFETGLPRRDLPAGLIGVLVILSWCFWNGRPGLDDWAPYFFGAYGLGILSGWAAGARLQGPRLVWMLLVAATAALLLFDWRGRMAVALATALVLARWGPRDDVLVGSAGALRWLGERSYSLFLVHFPVLMLVNTAMGASALAARLPAALWLGLALGLGMALAAVFHTVVERPCMALLSGRLPALSGPHGGGWPASPRKLSRIMSRIRQAT